MNVLLVQARNEYYITSAA